MDHAAARDRMIRHQLVARGVRDRRVLQAFADTPRHRFADPGLSPAAAYADAKLPLGDGRWTEEPIVLARVLRAARAGPGRRVLELGTGGGWAAALLAAAGAEVWSLEIDAALSRTARERLDAARHAVTLAVGDARHGWPETSGTAGPAEPFDAVWCSSAVENADALRAICERYLAPGGRVVAALGRRPDQRLSCLTVDPGGGFGPETKLAAGRFERLV